jgi:hypothetical protein
MIAVVTLAGIALGAWYSRDAVIVADIYSRVATGEFVDPSLAGLQSVKFPQRPLDWLESTAKTFFGVTSGLGTVPWGLAALVGAIATYRRDRGRAVILLACAFLPFALLQLGSLKPSPRYFLFVVPFFFLLAGAGVGRMGRRLAQDLARSSAARGRPSSQLAFTLFVALLVQSPSYRLLYLNLTGPGASHMGVKWDLHAAAAHVAERARPGDLLVPFPDPDIRTHFVALLRFHEQHQVARVLNAPAPSASERTVWFVTPDVLPRHDLEVLPPGLELELAASFHGAHVYAGQLSTGAPHPLDTPVLDWSSGELQGWIWNLHVGYAGWTVEGGTPPTLALRAHREAANAEVYTPPIPIEPGQVVELATRVRVEGPSALRPLATIGINFLDAHGERVVRAVRDGLTYSEAPADEDGWSDLRLALPVPRAARAVEFSLGLADGNVAGTVAHFAPPTLTVAPSTAVHAALTGAHASEPNRHDRGPGVDSGL